MHLIPYDNKKTLERLAYIAQVAREATKPIIVIIDDLIEDQHLRDDAESIAEEHRKNGHTWLPPIYRPEFQYSG